MAWTRALLLNVALAVLLLTEPPRSFSKAEFEGARIVRLVALLRAEARAVFALTSESKTERSGLPCKVDTSVLFA